MASESSKGIEWRSLLQLAQKSPAAALALKHLAAVVIQSNYRGAVVRRKYKACIATRRAIDRAVPQITLSLLEECYLGMCTAIVLEIMEKSTSRQAAEQALQEEMMSVFRDVASQVVYDEVRRFVVPKAIREITDTLIRKERKPTRINPLVAVVDDLLGEASGELVPRAVIQAIRDVTDEYLLHAKAEWMLQQIVQELVDADVREWVTEEVAAFAQIKEEWVSEEIVSAVAADVATDAHAELTRLQQEDQKELLLKKAVTDQVNRVMWSRLAGVHLAELLMDNCSAIVVRRELRDVAYALAADRLLRLLDEGEAKTSRLRNNFMMRQALNNFARDVVGRVLVEELVKRLSGSSSSSSSSSS